MRIQDIMSSAVETIAPSAAATLANELMWRQQIHHLVVVEGERVVGVLCDSDLGGDEAADIPENKQVRDFMTTPAVTAKPDMTIDRVIHLFEGRKIHCLPVVSEEGKLLGLIRASDIDNLATRGASNRAYEGEDTGPYPPLNRVWPHSSASKPY